MQKCSGFSAREHEVMLPQAGCVPMAPAPKPLGGNYAEMAMHSSPRPCRHATRSSTLHRGMP